MAKLDPKDYQGKSPEVSERDSLQGLYVYEPKDEFDNVVGSKKYIKTRAPEHAEAFLRTGFRLASEDEQKEYDQMALDARSDTRKKEVEEDAKRQEELIGQTGNSVTPEELAADKEASKASKKETK